MKPGSLSRRRAVLAALACTLLGLAGAGRATADTLQVTYDARGAGIPSPTGNFTFMGTPYNAFIGEFVMHLDNGSQFGSFCVDLDHNISPTNTFAVQTRSTSDGLTEGPQIAYLYNKYAGGGQTIFTPADNDTAAALQVAIWKLSADGGTSDVDKLNAGNFQFDPTKNPDGSTVASLAVGYIDEALAHSDVGVWLDASLGGTVPDHKQNVLGPTPPAVSPAAAVPEPGSALLVALGLAGGALYRRWRRGAA
jgi:hypothetical protein